MNLKTCQQILCSAFDPSVPQHSFERAQKIINSTEAFSPAGRLIVYRQSITGTQERVLYMLYPVCIQILGESCFSKLMRDYIWSMESNHADLNQYGENFPQWLAKQLRLHPYLKDYQYLTDLAHFEWHWHQALFAEDNPQFDFEVLTQLVDEYGEDIIPQLSNSLYLFTSPWPVYDIWQSHKAGQEDVEYELSDQSYQLIYRQDVVCVYNITPVTYRFFQLCQQQQTLSQIANKLGDSAEQCFAHMATFTQNGWISGFKAQAREETIEPDV